MVNANVPLLPAGYSQNVRFITYKKFKDVFLLIVKMIFLKTQDGDVVFRAAYYGLNISVPESSWK